MLNTGKKIIALRDKINELLCCPKKKILNETKNHNPPIQVKWSVPYIIDFNCFSIHWKLS